MEQVDELTQGLKQRAGLLTQSGYPDYRLFPVQTKRISLACTFFFSRYVPRWRPVPYHLPKTFAYPLIPNKVSHPKPEWSERQDLEIWKKSVTLSVRKRDGGCPALRFAQRDQRDQTIGVYALRYSEYVQYDDANVYADVRPFVVPESSSTSPQRSKEISKESDIR